MVDFGFPVEYKGLKTISNTWVYKEWEMDGMCGPSHLYFDKTVKN
jgi:hypothetical protein